MVAFLYGSVETEEPFSYKDLDDLFSVIDARYKESRPTIADKLRTTSVEVGGEAFDRFVQYLDERVKTEMPREIKWGQNGC